MATQGTDNLVIVDNMPAVEKLWNGRYRLEFFCKIQNPNEGWYSDSIDKWLPSFGALQDADFAGEGWSARDGEAYPDMRLVKCEAKYIAPSETHLVTLTYETLTASWVAEKDEDIDYELNGLQRVSRTFVALPDTSYAKVVGTDTITVGGDTLTLGAFKIEETDATWSLTETWLEPGELSRSDDLESGNESISITNIGACPTAPAGYTAVKQEERDTQGFPTCSITFYKDNSILSRSNDYVGSQLAETIEVFNPTAEPVPSNGGVLANKSVSNVDGIPTTRYTFLVPSVLSESTDNVGSQLAKVIEAFNEIPATPSGYVLARTDVSDFEGIPTRRYTFLKPSTLSESTDNVGSQKAKVIEAFSEVPTTPSGYSLASKQVSDFDGIKTNRYTFLKPSILSVSQQFIGGSATVQVQAFNKTSAEVDAALSEVTASHVLISEGESDYEGIKTSTYQYQLDESFTEDYELNGLKRISLIELSATNFTAQTFGNISVTAPTAGLYLGTQEIDNGGTVKLRESVWIESGVLNVQRRSESEGVYRVTTTFLGEEGTVVGPIVARVEDNYEGFKTTTVVSMQDAGGSSLVSGGSQPVASHSNLSEFSYPGVVTISSETLSGIGGTYTFRAKDFSLKPPVVARVEATVKVSFKPTSAISYTGTDGLWNPTTWAEGFSRGIGWNYSPFSISRGFRGYRIDSNATNSYSGYGIPGTANIFDMISGNRIFGNTTYSIEVSGGPENPDGNQYTLDYSVSLAFEDVDGTPYYKHKEIVATIPTQ